MSLIEPQYTALITDESLYVVGDPISNWTTLDVTLRFNEPGSAILTVPAHSDVVSQLNPGNRVVLIRDLGAAYGGGQILIAGPIEDVLVERSDDGDNAGDGKATITFADDLARIAALCAYPNPALAASAQTTDNWTFAGNAEVAMRTVVDQNAGPSALAARQVPMLALGALSSVGSTVTIKADRMQPLGDLLRAIAVTGGALGFRTRQSGGQILFEVYQPVDVSAQVRFGFNLGNLKYIAYQRSAPKVTTAFVGGQGTGASAFMQEVTNSSDENAWGRFEKLVAEDGSQPTGTLTDEGNRALADGASTTRMPANIQDNDGARFGVDYHLGDKVAIETLPGQQYADIVSTVHLQAWATAGEVVSATVGSQAAQSDPQWVQKLREIDQRLNKLSPNVVPG